MEIESGLLGIPPGRRKEWARSGSKMCAHEGHRLRLSTHDGTRFWVIRGKEMDVRGLKYQSHQLQYLRLPSEILNESRGTQTPIGVVVALTTDLKILSKKEKEEALFIQQPSDSGEHCQSDSNAFSFSLKATRGSHHTSPNQIQQPRFCHSELAPKCRQPAASILDQVSALSSVPHLITNLANNAKSSS